MNNYLNTNDEPIIDLKFFFWFILTFCCLFFQFIPYANYLLVAGVFVFVVYCFYKRWQSGLIPILCLSFLHGEASVSIYTLKIGGISSFYILILTLFSLKLYTRKAISKIEALAVLFFTIYLLYSIIRLNFLQTSYFINDALFLLIGLLFLFSIYDFEDINFDKLLFSISLGYFLTKIIVAATGIGLQVTAYSSTIDQYSAIFDPVENFLLIYNIQSFFFPKSRGVKMLSLFNVLLFGASAYLLGYIHGATIVLIFIVVVYVLLRNLKVLFFLALGLFVIISINNSIDINSLFNTQGESVFIYKIEKVFGLFDFLYSSTTSVYDLPRSTQVRLIETINLFGQDPFSLIFGNGYGGYLTETLYEYGSYLNEDDYSIDQIALGQYQALHAYNQIVLKHGLLSIFIATCLLWKFRRAENRNFRDMALLFVIISYSFTIKPYLILALLVFSFKRCKR